MRKGEIACYKQFLLSSQCFPQLYISEHQNVALCGNGLNTVPNNYVRENSLLLGRSGTKHLGVLGSNLDQILYFCQAFIHLFLC